MNRGRAVVALFAASLLPRVLAVWVASGDPVLAERVVATDSRDVYLPLASNVAAGHGFLVLADSSAPLTIPPVYPLWLASLEVLVGPPAPALVGLLQAVLRSLAVVALFGLAGRWLPPRAALCAALLYALDPWEAFWTPYVLKESVAVPLLLVALDAWFVARDRPSSLRTHAAAGAAMAVAALAWFGSAVLAAWSLRSLLAAGRPGWPRAAAYAGSALSLGLVWVALIVSAMPETARDWVPKQLIFKFGGRSFSPTAPTTGYPPDKLPREVIRDLRQLGRPGTGARLARLLARVPGNLGRSAVNLWRPVHAGSSLHTVLLFGVPFVAFMALAVAGLVLARREGTDLGGLPALVAAITVVLLLLSGGVRQRQYLTPLLAVPAGLALARLADLRAARRVV